MALVAFLVPVAQAAAAEVPLTTAIEGSGAGTIKCDVGSGPEACDAEYPEETEIFFIAEPNEGSEFAEWGADCIGQGDECELTLEEATTVAAVFELVEVPLEVLTEGEGLGEVECEVESGPAEECEAEYPYGAEIAFVAAAEEGSEFVEWGEDCSGSGSCELTMDEEHSVSALFDLAHFVLEVEVEGSGSGTVTSEPAGIDCGVECEAEYLEGEEVILTAEAEPGSKFVEWAGCDAEPSAEECEVTIDADKSVSAVFEVIEFVLEVEVEGSGSGTVTSSPAGIDCGVECEAEYEEGEEVTLTAEADSGSEFTGWTGCDAEPSAEECEVTIDADKVVTATFDTEPTPEFTLEVEKQGAGSGTVTSSPSGISCGATCSAKYEEGEVVTLTASPGAGSKFAGWTGCEEEPSATECEVTVDEDVTVAATFDLEPPSEFALTVALAGSGSGTVTSSPSGINCGVDCSEAYAAGAEVTLTATPASGSTFTGWSGDCAGTGSCKVTMSAARGVTATFGKESAPSGIAVVAPTAKVKAGKARLKVTCQGEGACKGTLKLTAKVKSGKRTTKKTIGKASFSLAAGVTKTIKVKLSGPAKQAVAKKPLKARVSGSGVRSSTVKLKK